MHKWPWFLIVGLSVTLSFLSPLSAQTAANGPVADAKQVPANPVPVPSGQAPDEVMKKLSDLIRAQKYAEAQQLCAGLLLAYPDDQRLGKAKALLDKLLAAPESAPAVAGASAAAATNASDPATPKLTGMDKVEYNSLLEQARQAQLSPDLAEQTTLLQRFMNDSSSFLQKHPEQMLLWQIRVASAISLNEPDAGYEAGQKLLAAGAADSDDANLQRLLGQLKSKGWLDKQSVEAQQKQEDSKRKVSWIIGVWKVTESWDYSSFLRSFNGSANEYSEVFVISDGTINGLVDGTLDLRGTILDSGDIKWECLLPNPGNDSRPSLAQGSNHTGGIEFNQGKWSKGWRPVISSTVNDTKDVMVITTPSLWWPVTNKNSRQHPVTYTFKKVGGQDEKGQAR